MKLFKRCVAFVCAVALLSAASIWLFEEERAKHMRMQGVFSDFPYFTERDVILDSDLIVLGKVTKIEQGKWSEPSKPYFQGNTIETEILVKPKEILSGAFDGKRIKVRIAGGYNKETNTILESYTEPTFSRGEEVVLFLKQKPGRDYFYLFADYHGKYTVKDDYLDRDAELDSELFYMTVDELKARIQEEKQQ